MKHDTSKYLFVICREGLESIRQTELEKSRLYFVPQQGNMGWCPCSSSRRSDCGVLVDIFHDSLHCLDMSIHGRCGCVAVHWRVWQYVIGWWIHYWVYCIALRQYAKADVMCLCQCTCGKDIAPVEGAWKCIRGQRKVSGRLLCVSESCWWCHHSVWISGKGNAQPIPPWVQNGPVVHNRE